MTIGGVPLADDLRRIEAVLAVLPEGCDLAVDADGRFDLDEAPAYADALSAYPLHWYEEAGDPLDPDRCVPHGGHQFNLSIASAFHLRGCESCPGVVEPSGGFADGNAVEDGHVGLPDAPGIGLERTSSLSPVLADLRG